MLADGLEQGLRGHEGRVREAIEKVCALGVVTQELEGLAIRRGVLGHECAKVFPACGVFGKGQETKERVLAPARLEVV